MDRRNVLTKTAKGVMELAGKTSLLARDVKRVLAIVDGKSTASELIPRLSNSDASKFGDFLAKLKQEGFVREVPAAVVGSSAAAARSLDDDLDFTSVISSSPRNADFKAKWKAEEEVQRKEEEARRRAAEEEARRKSQEEARRRTEAEIEAKRKAAEEIRRQVEAEARRKLEEDARRKAELNAKQSAEEIAIRKAEEEAKRQIEEARRKAEANARRIVEQEEEARRLAEEDPRWSAEDDERRNAEREARSQAEDVARNIAKAEAKRQPPARTPSNPAVDLRNTEEEARAKADESAKRIADEMARRLVEAEAKKIADAEAKRKAEEDARNRAAAEARRQAEERARRVAEEESRRKAEEAARLKAAEEARRIAEEDARRRAEMEARRRAEEQARQQAEAEARRKAEEEAQRRAEEEARQRAEAEARRKAEEQARRRAEEEARQRAEAEARRIAEEEARRQAEEEECRLAEEAVRQEAEEIARRRAEEEARRQAQLEAKRQAEAARRRIELDAKEQEAREQEARQRSEVEARRRAEEGARVEAAKRAEDLVRSAAKSGDSDFDFRKSGPTVSLFAPDTKFEIDRDAALKGTFEEVSALSAADRAEADEISRLVNQRREKDMLASKVAHEAAERREIERPASGVVEKPAPARPAPPPPSSARAPSVAPTKERAVEIPAREALPAVEAPSPQPGGAIEHSVEPAAAPVATPTRSRRVRRKLGGGAIAIVLSVALIGGVGFVLTRGLDVKFYESIASVYFSMPVRIGTADLSLLPSPAMQFKKIVIGTGGEIKIDEARAVPSLFSLFGDDRKFTSIELDGATLSSQTLIRVPGLAPGSRTAMSIASVEARNVTILDPSWTMSNMIVSGRVDGARGVSSVALRDVANTISIALTPGSAGRAKFEFSAPKINPLGASFELTDFEARGSYGGNEVTVDKFDGRIFDGVIRGGAKIQLRKDAFAINGTVEARAIKMQRLAPAIFESGETSGQGTFAGAARQIDKLLATPALEMAFTADRGMVRGFDTTQVLQNARTINGTSTLASGSGTLQVNGGRINLSAFRFNIGSVAASAVAVVEANENVNGLVGVEQRTPMGMARGTVAVGGTLSKPTFARGK